MTDGVASRRAPRWTAPAA